MHREAPILTNGGDEGGVEGIVGEAEEHAGLADARVADQQQFEEQVIGFLRHGALRAARPAPPGRPPSPPSHHTRTSRPGRRRRPPSEGEGEAQNGCPPWRARSSRARAGPGRLRVSRVANSQGAPLLHAPLLASGSANPLGFLVAGRTRAPEGSKAAGRAAKPD